MFAEEKIQSVTHDSIEDARTALNLYRKYLDLQEENTFSLELEKLYETGKMIAWKVPGNDDNDLSSGIL